jgi:hypothetical protein
VLDRVGHRDQAGAVDGAGHAQQHSARLVVLGVVEDVDHRAELVPGPVEHDPALPPSRDGIAAPSTRAGTATEAAAVGWYGADVNRELLVGVVKFDSYGRLGQDPGKKSTKK